MECLEAKLPEHLELAVKRMLAQNRLPIDISAIFRAVPERARYADAARTYAEGFTSCQILILQDVFDDERRDRSERYEMLAERRRMMEQLAAARVKARSEESEKHTPDDQIVNPKSRKTFHGLPVTSLIRLLSSMGWSKDQVGKALSALTGSDIHPATLHIQWTRGQKGDGIPEVPEDHAKAFKKFVKENR